MHIQIWHNKNERESFFRGYEQHDPVEKVFDQEMSRMSLRDDEAVCEYVFQSNQHVDATRRPWYKGARSMSVGDVVVIDDRAYSVETIGFQEITWMQ